ncbi:hypothetical protein UFOVP116_68 [uncultured Caudovirales phage]|uniref:Uncharacterized protein n=1 Tax=uncultured Caudovirales phage TaxID=2100421 RepID=A0A6J5L8S0_9CAUD|nr:hypothetical protein UFOVP116_68 [uncultured Caudovirales phage]
MYATPIIVYQNIDNPLEFIFRDRDQKRISIHGYQVNLNIITANSPTANQVVKSSTSVVAVKDGTTVESAVTNGTMTTSPFITIPLTVLDDGVDAQTRGRATVVVTKGAVNGLCPDDYWYSIAVTNQANVSMPAFTDGNGTARGTLKLIGGIY